MEGAITAKGRCKVDSVAALAQTTPAHLLRDTHIVASPISLSSRTHLRDPTAPHRTVGFWRHCTQDARHDELEVSGRTNAKIPHVVSSMSSENLRFQLLDVIEVIFNAGGQAVLDRLQKGSSAVVLGLRG